MSVPFTGVLALILGGGKGECFVAFVPLNLNQTSRRSKPAMPLAGKFRLVDIPLSKCINSDICKF